VSQPADTSQVWSRHAAATRRRVNLAWWFEKLAPFLVVGGVALAAVILYLRSVHRPIDGITAAGIGGGLLLLSALLAWVLARKRFISGDQGMVRLESRMELHNALSTAKAGISPWPAEPEGGADDGYGWRWNRVLSPILIASFLVLGAFFVPVAGLTDRDPDIVAKPRAWEDMDSWMDVIEESGAVEEEAIEDARESLEKLAQQKEDEWFSHSSLEATDTLRDQLKDSIQKLGQDSEKAERSLSALAQHSEKMSGAAKDQLMAEYSDALEKMGQNSMTPNEELMSALGALDPSQIPQLSPEQLQNMKEALQKAQQAAQDALGDEAQSGLPPLGGT